MPENKDSTGERGGGAGAHEEKRRGMKGGARRKSVGELRRRYSEEREAESNQPFSMSSRGSPTRPVTPDIKSSMSPPTIENENLASPVAAELESSIWRSR